MPAASVLGKQRRENQFPGQPGQSKKFKKNPGNIADSISETYEERKEEWRYDKSLRLKEVKI